MDAQLQAKIAKAQAKINSLWGEPVIFGATGSPIPAIMGHESLTQRFVEGKGIEEVTTLRCSIARALLSTPPSIGTPSQARNRSWRVWLVEPTQTTWEITLDSPRR